MRKHGWRERERGRKLKLDGAIGKRTKRRRNRRME